MTARFVREFLQSLAGQRVFLDPLFGNHGDHMIAKGAEQLLESAPLVRAADPASADWILVNGGGGMAEGWPGLGIVQTYGRRFPDKPLAVLPSSYLFRDENPGRWFAGRNAPLWLWARETASLNLIRELNPPCELHTGLDHDLALALAGQPTLESLLAVEPEPVVLAVERDDWESPTGRRRPLAIPGLSFIPEAWRNTARKALLGPLRRRQDQASPFGQAAMALLPELGVDATGMGLHCEDISLGEVCGFDEFLHAIARASVIVSTRLHVAILGHLLGRPTVLVEGNWHKARGVFEHSLAGGSTRLARWRDGALHLYPAGRPKT